MSDQAEKQSKEEIGPEPPDHVVPARILVGVTVTALALTWISVEATSRVDLGGFGIHVAIGIATIQATLVALFSMGLIWEKPFPRSSSSRNLIAMSPFDSRLTPMCRTLSSRSRVRKSST